MKKKSGGGLLVWFIIFVALFIVGDGWTVVQSLWAEHTGKGENVVAVSVDKVTEATGSLPGLKVVSDSQAAGGYAREKFGPAWKDVDRNGCDTRNDMLGRDLTNKVMQSGSRCVVQSGVLETDPYTGQKIVWRKGDQPGIDIDHIVPLKRAWEMGASAWSDEQRLAYANDPMVLLTVSGSANREKSDKGPGKWMPSHDVCGYSVRYISVSAKYGLAISQSDRQALEKGLAKCVS